MSSGIVVKPFDLERFAESVCSIDGAVFLDENCKVYGIGFILDGMANDKETLGRGARYNSAVRYFNGHEDSCVIFVVSADETVDIFPQ